MNVVLEALDWRMLSHGQRRRPGMLVLESLKKHLRDYSARSELAELDEGRNATGTCQKCVETREINRHRTLWLRNATEATLERRLIMTATVRLLPDTNLLLRGLVPTKTNIFGIPVSGQSRGN